MSGVSFFADKQAGDGECDEGEAANGVEDSHRDAPEIAVVEWAEEAAPIYGLWQQPHVLWGNQPAVGRVDFHAGGEDAEEFLTGDGAGDTHNAVAVFGKGDVAWGNIGDEFLAVAMAASFEMGAIW